MRLIYTRTVEVVDGFLGTNTPAYAILSHKWEEDEVSFQDIHNPQSRRKHGYVKIKAACEQALRDGYDYVWIDTCCIDKSSSAELSEAINSMFVWYQQAAICYVYLPDVDGMDSLDGLDISSKIFKSQLRSSKWFSRGWTLQELIAPSKLVFFAEDWSPLPGRAELADLIHETTGIAKTFLLRTKSTDMAQLLRQASIAERMSWAANRRTTRIEDQAYSLLGIFEVNMPLLYGEGGNAFLRLQHEIARHSSDQSLLAWRYEDDGGDSDGFFNSIFADSPAAFALSGDIMPFEVEADGGSSSGGVNPSFSVTNRGLHITMPFCGQDGVLQCRRRGNVSTLVTVPLRKMRQGVYARAGTGRLGCIDYRGWHQWPHKAIYLEADTKSTYDIQNGFFLRHIPQGFRVPGFTDQPEAMYFPLRNLPAWQWGQSEETSSIHIFRLGVGGNREGNPVASLTLSACCVSADGLFPYKQNIRTRAHFMQQPCDPKDVLTGPRARISPTASTIARLPDGGFLYANIKPTRIFGRRLFMVDIVFSLNKVVMAWLQVSGISYANYHRAVLALVSWFPLSLWTRLAAFSICLFIFATLGIGFNLIAVVVITAQDIVYLRWGIQAPTMHWLPLGTVDPSLKWFLVVLCFSLAYSLLRTIRKRQRYTVYYPGRRGPKSKQQVDLGNFLLAMISLWFFFLVIYTLVQSHAYTVLFASWSVLVAGVFLLVYATEETSWHALIEGMERRRGCQEKKVPQVSGDDRTKR